MKIILPLFLLTIFSCSGFSIIKTFPIYGNYCGNGNPKILQEAAPINTIDFLCQERLFCMRKNYKNTQPCDEILAVEMKKIHAANDQEKEIKKAIIAYFDR